MGQWLQRGTSSFLVGDGPMDGARLRRCSSCVSVSFDQTEEELRAFGAARNSIGRLKRSRSASDCRHGEACLPSEQGAQGRLSINCAPAFRRVTSMREWVDDEQRSRLNDYIMVRKVGQGQYGEVFLVHHSNSFVNYAIKKVAKPRSAAGQTEHTAQAEVDILTRLCHTNVVRVFEIIDDPSATHACIVFEYVDGGPVMELDSTGVAKQDPIPAALLRTYVEQMAEGLQYLHGRNVVHCDVKPENILVTRSSVIKIADLGVGRLLTSSDDHLRATFGTPMFLSPEACKGEVCSAKANDVWAFGLTVYVMVYGMSPFRKAPTQMQLFNRIVNQPIPYPPTPPAAMHTDEEALLLMLRRTLERDPLSRITLNELRNCSWICGTDALPRLLSLSAKNGSLVLPAPTPTRTATAGKGFSSPLRFEPTSAEDSKYSSNQDSLLPLIGLSAEKDSCISVLIVEDVFIIQKVLSKILRTLMPSEVELTVKVATDGDHAVTACQESRFDLVFMDIHLSSCSGIAAAGQVYQYEDERELPRTAIVGVTADPDEAVHRLCLDVGMTMVLQKPITPDAMRECLASHGLPVRTKDELAIFSITEEFSKGEVRGGAKRNAILRSYNQHIQSVNDSVASRSSRSSVRTSTAEATEGGAGHHLTAEPAPSTIVSLRTQSRNCMNAQRTMYNAGGDDSPDLDELELAAPVGVLAQAFFCAIGSVPAARLWPRLIARFRQHAAADQKRLLSEAKGSKRDIPREDFVKAGQEQEWWSLLVAEATAGDPYERPSVQAFAFMDKGLRAAQEDRLTVLPCPSTLLNDAERAASVGEGELLAAVFDGHGGCQASAFCARNLLSKTARHPDFLTDPVSALRSAFSECHETFVSRAIGVTDAGTTALVALVRGGELTVANAGDCRAVLASGGAPARQLTSLHLAADPQERAIVEARGGEVLYYCGTWRVNGMLGVTRSIGDIPCASSVTSEPEISIHTIAPEDEFVILATDGLWDVMSPQEAVQLVREARAEIDAETHAGVSECSSTSSMAQPLDHSVIPEALVADALDRGTGDNVSCVVVFLNEPSRPI